MQLAIRCLPERVHIRHELYRSLTEALAPFIEELEILSWFRNHGIHGKQSGQIARDVSELQEWRRNSFPTWAA